MGGLLCCISSSEDEDHSADERSEIHHELNDEEEQVPTQTVGAKLKSIELQSPYKTVDLNPQVTVLTQDEFQSKWKELPYSLHKQYSVKKRELKENELEILEDCFSKRFVYTLASGVVSQTYKLYMYAEQVSTEDNEKSTWLLLEVVISMDTLLAYLRMKTDDKEYIETFRHYIESIISDRIDKEVVAQ